MVADLALSSLTGVAAGESGCAPLSVCYVSADYPLPGTRALGGIGAHTYALAHAVAALGHRVTIVTQGDVPGPLQDGNVEVHVLAPPSLRMWKLGRVLPLPWVRRSFAVWRALRRLSRTRRFDVVSFPDGYGEGFVHSFAPVAPSVVQLFGPNTVVQIWDGRQSTRLLFLVQRYLERRPAVRARLCIAATRRFADDMVRLWSLEPSRIAIIRNPLNLVRFRPTQGSASPAPRILFVGHLQKLKGVQTLIEAAPIVLQHCPSAEIVLVGNDTASGPGRTSMQSHLLALIRELGVEGSVRLVEPVPQVELVTMYQRSTLFVLPSFNDVYPNAVLEAMACGKPCVVTTTVGVAELVDDYEAGATVPPGDPAALAEAIVQISKRSQEQLERLGMNARTAVERCCSTEVIAEQTISAYRSMLRESASGIEARTFN
jgi:glycosyltransferase involved in cell wall biosynthesis